MVSKKQREQREALSRALARESEPTPAVADDPIFSGGPVNMIMAHELPVPNWSLDELLKMPFRIRPPMAPLSDEETTKILAERKALQQDPPVRPAKIGMDWQDFMYGAGNSIEENNPGIDHRLKYWFDQWSAPTGEKGYGSQVGAQRIFFGILAREGHRREDFNWKRFRAAYFTLDRRVSGGEQRKRYVANQAKYKADKKRKGKK
jgi:hypothetical protein